MYNLFIKKGMGDRNPINVRKHYEIEKELANRLKKASENDRRGLYSEVYDELFSKISDHPQITTKKRKSKVDLSKTIFNTIKLDDTVFLEIGPGDCSLSIEVSKYAKMVYAADVSSSITRLNGTPSNFELVLFDGIEIPSKISNVDIAYSYHVVEHLHPKDFVAQTKSVYESLIEGGKYICVTPNRLNGPHDVSKYFEKTAKGFHLKEYTTIELVKMLKGIGFRKVVIFNGFEGRYFKTRYLPIMFLEKTLELLPDGISKIIANSPIRLFLGIKLMAIK